MPMPCQTQSTSWSSDAFADCAKAYCRCSFATSFAIIMLDAIIVASVFVVVLNSRVILPELQILMAVLGIIITLNLIICHKRPGPRW